MAGRGWLSIAVLAGLLLSIPGDVSRTAFASREGRRNTALILGGATLYSLSRGRGTEALILGTGTYFAYKRYRDSRGRVHWRRVRVRSYGRHPGWRRGHHYGWDHDPGWRQDHPHGWLGNDRRPGENW